VPVRAPHLYDVLRAFCLAAFAKLGPEVEQGSEIPFVVEESSGFYEYRPLVRDHILARAFWLAQLEDARIAIDELRQEPAAAIFARAHDGPESFDERALFRAILLPLLTRTAEACGGFDWEDGAFGRVYAELERSLFGASRSFRACAAGRALGRRSRRARARHPRPRLVGGRAEHPVAGVGRPAPVAFRLRARADMRARAGARAAR
jgi:hypothetical protein